MLVICLDIEFFTTVRLYVFGVIDNIFHGFAAVYITYILIYQ